MIPRRIAPARGLPQLPRKPTGSVPSTTTANGSTRALGLNESHEPVFRGMVQEHARAVTPSTPTPSIHSLRGGSMHRSWASPTTRGATTTNPIRPDQNHAHRGSEYDLGA